jgi:hypothetical protein
MFDIRRYEGHPVTTMTHRRWISRRQIRCHYRPDNLKMFDLETSPSPQRLTLRIPSVEFSIGRYMQGNVPMRQLLAGPFRPFGGMVIGWPPVAVCQCDVGKQYRPSRLCPAEIKLLHLAQDLLEMTGFRASVRATPAPARSAFRGRSEKPPRYSLWRPGTRVGMPNLLDLARLRLYLASKMKLELQLNVSRRP